MSAAHTSGVGSPTHCACPACRAAVRRSLAYAISHPDAALSPFRIEDAERILGDRLTIREAHALLCEVESMA